MRTVNLILISSFLTACGMTDQTNNSTQAVLEQPNTEAFRPAYHFTPPKNWMNDPNGMVYFQGEYHLFYQHNPHSSVWGPMHWGHAISKDMVHWEHQEIKLYPDEHGTIFSGSAVVDWQNSSGFGSKDNPPLVAMYTYHDEEKAAQFREALSTLPEKGLPCSEVDSISLVANANDRTEVGTMRLRELSLDARAELEKLEPGQTTSILEMPDRG